MLRGSTVTAHCSARGMIRIRYSVSLLLVTDREHSFIVVWDEHPLAIHSGLRIVKVEMKPDRYIALYGVHIDFVVLGVFWSSDSIISAILAPATPMQYGARSRIWSIMLPVDERQHWSMQQRHRASTGLPASSTDAKSTSARRD